MVLVLFLSLEYFDSSSNLWGCLACAHYDWKEMLLSRHGCILESVILLSRQLSVAKLSMGKIRLSLTRHRQNSGGSDLAWSDGTCHRIVQLYKGKIRWLVLVMGQRKTLRYTLTTDSQTHLKLPNKRQSHSRIVVGLFLIGSVWKTPLREWKEGEMFHIWITDIDFDYYKLLEWSWEIV